MVFFSSMISLYYLLKKVTGYEFEQGWISLILSIWFTGGLIVTSLGVASLYIGKIFEQVKKRPKFIIAEVIGYK